MASMENDNIKEFIDGMEEQELLQCLQAAKLADGEAPGKVAMERAEAFVNKTIRASRTGRVIRFAFVSMLAAAACVAVAVFIGRNPGGGEIQPYVAAVDTVETQSDLQEQVVEPVIPEIGKENERMASNREKQEEEVVRQQEPILSEIHEAETVVHSATTAIKTLKMVRPNKELYKVRVVDESKLFSFVWESDSIATCMITLSDSLGNTIVEKEINGDNHYELAASDALKYGKILWTVRAIFKDQSQRENKGIVIFDKAE